MKAKLALVIFVLAPVLAFAGNNVQITEVGLKGYYSPRSSTPVAVQVDVPPGVESIQVEFKVSVGEDQKFGPWQVDHFSRRVHVHPGETTQLAVPLQLPVGEHSKLELNVSNAQSHRIGSSTVSLSSLNKGGWENLIAVLCKDHTACDEAQSQISFSGSEEEVAEKDHDLKFVALLTPRPHWLDYAVARFVIVAGPLSNWTPEQRFALEAYARQGGALVLLENECADAGFLAPYRAGTSKGPVLIGRGSLYRAASLSSRELGGLFSGKSWKSINARPYVPWGSPVDSFRRVAAISFDFPRLRWLLIWLAAYILIIGLGNFALLRRLRRLEWGWVTTTALAVLFAIGLYLAGSANRPRRVTLDDLAVYWMDGKSPIASETIGLRVSSPERQSLAVSVGDAAILTAGSPANAGASDVDIATEITHERRLQPGWDVRLGPPVQVELSLLRWSFTDLDFQTLHTFPGTVTISQNLHLKNETGQLFHEVMYLDFPENRKYLISELNPGQEVDLTAVPPAPIYVRIRREAGEFTVESNEEPPGTTSPSSSKAASYLTQLLYRGSQFGALKHVFVGIGDGPTPEAFISGPKFVQNNLSLTVVALDQP